MQILLDDARLERLRERAESEGRSVGAVVRSAIDRELERVGDDHVAAAAASLLSAQPLPIGTPDELDRELDTLWDRHRP